jgi:hypothetical protein
VFGQDHLVKTLLGAEVDGGAPLYKSNAVAFCPRAFDSPLVHFRAPIACKRLCIA